MEKSNYSQHEPMNIYEAIEAMKIVARYRKEIEDSKTVFDAVRDMLKTAKEREDAMSIARLLALIEHNDDLEGLIREVKQRGGMEYVARLGQGLINNPIGDLLNGSTILGMTKSQGIVKV